MCLLVSLRVYQEVHFGVNIHLLLFCPLKVDILYFPTNKEKERVQVEYNHDDKTNECGLL